MPSYLSNFDQLPLTVGLLPELVVFLLKQFLLNAVVFNAVVFNASSESVPEYSSEIAKFSKMT